MGRLFFLLNERVGNVSLKRSDKISRFYIDTIVISDSSNGPTLYKKLRLTSTAT
ncbi:hypothetical protein LSS_21075 [Leptospira santarosai serovar Shermani str. LT 821]|uniref:Uncharacterized protein n=1 Tax=Leptospira santarosai serovar Shermani str. LT 821 TaxID=758847 RepID=A0A097ESC1_9LEPT|nr:hypothetical protein LSS_21075 [Leptospira santarosai serovar Shermani str. LT 821]EPG83345.1 hypothetical protein LEP1GSC048_2743 [Leptospira santarosai serovar Shermani str. 1342KT]